MTTPRCDGLGQRLRSAIEKPFGRTWRTPAIVASVFFTYTFNSQEFEQFLLPDLFGVGANRVTSGTLRQLQCALAQDGASPPVVFHDARISPAALMSGERARTRSLRVDAVPVRWGDSGRACMHAKHVLIVVKNEDDALALVFATMSANLTASGWRKNVELADVRTLEPASVTSLAPGLRDLMTMASSWARAAGHEDIAALPGLRTVADFIEGLRDDPDAWPRLWTGRNARGEPESLETAIVGAAAALGLTAAERLSVGSPYVSDDAAPIARLVDAFAPGSIEVLRPKDPLGFPMTSDAWETSVRALRGTGAPATLHHLEPSLFGGEKGRTTHLKWILVEDRTRGLLVLGSPNLSDAAFAGRDAPGANVETALLLPVPKGLNLLESEPLAPEPGRARSEDADDPNAPDAPTTAPLLLVYDWSKTDGSRASLRWFDGCPRDVSGQVIRTLGGARTEPLITVDGLLSEPACRVVEHALNYAPLAEILDPLQPAKAPWLVHIVEVRQELAPARAEVHLTGDGLLRMLVAAGTGDARTVARQVDAEERAAEDNDELGRSPDARPALALDRPILLLQATRALERRVNAAHERGDATGSARVLYQPGGLSVRALVDALRRRDEAFDDVDRIVGWLSVKALLADEPAPEPRDAEGRRQLEEALSELETAWSRVPLGEQSTRLRTWLEDSWRTPAVAKGSGST